MLCAYPGWLGESIWLIQVQRVVLFFINLVFIFSSLYFASLNAMAALRHKPSPATHAIHQLLPSTWYTSGCLLGTIWIASILQTLLDHGDNPRFLVPMQSLVVLWVALFIFQLINHKQALTGEPPHFRMSESSTLRMKNMNKFQTEERVLDRFSCLSFSVQSCAISVDGSGHWLQGWIAYSVMLWIGAFSILWLMEGD